MRPTYSLIHTSHLKYNFLNIRKKVKNSKVMAVVKADAYGHGMIKCAEVLNNLGDKSPDYFGVALLEEAIELRKSKIVKQPILSFAPFDKNEIDVYKKLKILPTVCSEKHVAQLLKVDTKLKVQINIDTGMGRLGFPYDKAVAMIQKILRNSKITIDGIYTHFATSDEKDKTYANLQLHRFNEVVENLKELKIDYGVAHAANSGAIIDMPDSYFDMVRPGISLYGYYPSEETSESIKLKPVMSLISKVSTVRYISKGESVSYGRKYFTDKDTSIISIPIGYADGFNRALTNSTSAIIRGNKYPQAGRVTMDRILFDVGDDKIREGDKVILLGAAGKNKITAWDWARQLQTIPYEITCAISKRVPRVYSK